MSTFSSERYRAMETPQGPGIVEQAGHQRAGYALAAHGAQDEHALDLAGGVVERVERHAAGGYVVEAEASACRTSITGKAYPKNQGTAFCSYPARIRSGRWIRFSRKNSIMRCWFTPE